MADIHNLEADTSVEPAEPPSSKAIVNLANRLLKEFNIATQIEDVCDISASLFVVLYESLFSDRLPGIIRHPVSKEDEVHNCQIVIDVLSTEVVKDSLSHIRGVDIVAGDSTAILNLLDIFSYLLEYVVKRIENETDLNDTGSVCTTEPEQDVPRAPASLSKIPSSSQKLKSMPKSKIGSIAASNTTNNNGAHLETSGKSKVYVDRNDNRKAFGTRDVITHEDFYAMSYGGISSTHEAARPPSPIKPDMSQSLLGQKSVDSDFDTDLEKSEEKAHDFYRDQPKVAWGAQPSEDAVATETVIDGVTLRGKKACNTESVAAYAGVTQTSQMPDRIDLCQKNGTVYHYNFTHHLFHHYDKQVATECCGHQAHTLPVREAPWESSAYSTERPIPSLSASMPAHHNQMQLNRSDPLRATVGPISYRSHTSPLKDETDNHGSHIPSAKGLSSSYNDLRELVEKTAALTRVALATSPVRARTTLDLDVTDFERDRPRPAIPSSGARLAKKLNAQSLSSANKRDPLSPGKSGKKVAFASLRDSGIHDYDPKGDLHTALAGWQASSEGYASDLESDYFTVESPPPSERQATNSGRHKLPKSKTGGQKKKTSASSSRQQFAKYLAQNRQPELGAAHMTLKTEDRAIRRKQEILRKFYEQDHQEFVDDVEYLLERDRQRSKELEEECVKKCTQGSLKKKIVKTGKAQAPKKPRISKPVGSKPKEKGEPVSASPLPLHLESEEDLLPFLLEEFPHLHLSEHTWHELWRRGLNQIEALTRTYEESQRKKSRAQCQLEEAAHRHELLADIMKKQLEHTKRLRDIKEQKQQQITTRNKMHEKRIQSARARRYYNEYQVRARSKQLKRRTKEEMVFRDLFKDALNIQRERIRDVRQYASDQRKKQESRRQDEIDSLENFYHDQFEMLAEKLSKEKMETEVRDAAQQKIMVRLKKELRKKMESEIKQYQEQLFRDDDDVHFRKCDADRALKQLHLARYSAKI